MIRACRYFIFSILILCAKNAFTQNISGTWEGRMGSEYLQINIVQKKNELCGYTYDYSIYDRREHCKAYFKGWYDKERDMWILLGTNFIENSGSHILMQIKLWTNGQSNNTLNGSVDAKDAAVSLMNWSSGQAIHLKKVPTDPANKAALSYCFPKIIKEKIPEKKETVAIKKPVPNNKKTQITKAPPAKPTVIKPAKTLQKADTLKRPDYNPTLVKKQNEYSSLVKKMNARKNTAFSHLQVNVKHITLSVYDNGTVDNDTVSIFYNGRLLVGKKLLSEKPLVINLELDEYAALHEITMFAENLGSIPPNTALIVVKAGDKRYELHSKASLEENAVLVFEYKPGIK
jgi:hypothetical protein